MKRLRLELLALLVPITIACGGDKEFKPKKPFEQDDDVRVWATNASALGAYWPANEPIAFADGAMSFPDPACPETSDDGTTVTIVGGCTDTNDREWRGRATILRSGDERLLTMESFLLDGMGDRDGTVLLTRLGPTLNEFDINIRFGVTKIDYVGTVEGDYGTRTVWNGEGHVERTGYFSPTGSVDATTVAEVHDDSVCAGQPVSGTTTLRSGNHTAVVVYDGATDCDAEKTAEVVVNDGDPRLIGGIGCAIGRRGASRGGSGSALLLLLIGLVAGVRRRRLA